MSQAGLDPPTQETRHDRLLQNRDVSQLRIRHVGDADKRAWNNVAIELRAYALSGGRPFFLPLQILILIRPADTGDPI